jgi:hypothetical protein
MLFSNWLSSLKYRWLLGGNARVRRGRRRARFTPELMQLEDRCVPSGFTPVLPTQGTVQNDPKGLNAVVYTPQGDPNFNQANLPAAKLVTIMNNSSNVVFPIFYGANSTADNTAGTVVNVVLNNPGSGYNSAQPPKVVIKDLTNHGNTTATATVNASGIINGVGGGLFGLTLTSGGSGYKPTDQLQVTFDDSANGNKGSGATATAFVSQVTQNGVASLYDPKDPLNNTFRGYVGEIVNGQYQLGLQPGHQVTVMVPITFWDGGRVYMVDNGSVPLTSQFDPGYPLQPNSEWTYNPSLTPNALAKIGAGLSYIVAPTAGDPTPLYGADFADPTTGYANPNGVVMWYHETPFPGQANPAHDFGFGVPAVLTEATFRDPKQPFIAPDMLPSQIQTINNYDVSYVDSLAVPSSMEATLVPTIPATPGPDQFTWLGSDLSTTQMQQAIQAFTTNNTSVNSPSPPNPNGLGTYFGGLGWDQFYMPPDNNSTASGTISQIINPSSPNNDIPVTIITTSTAGLVSGGAVTISGVTGQTALNSTWIISNITPTSFALTNIAGDGTTSSGGSWTAFRTTGVHLQKLPAGYDTITQSSNLNVLSQFDATRYSLVSGGTQANISTLSTGVSTAGSNTIQNVSTAIARQLVVGMLWSPVNPPSSQTPYFPNGTTISSIQIGTTGNNDSTITMSNKANASGSPGFPGAGGSWTFEGSQYSTANSPPSLQGSIGPNSNLITGIDPNVGMYLRPGMLVTGGGIQSPSDTIPPTFIKSISSDFTTITLTQNGTATGGSGPYTFVGAPDSYIVQTLINNWYAWADYYVSQLAAGANAAPIGTFAAQTTANTGPADYNSLILKITDPNFNMNTLRVGDVVTGTNTGPTQTLTPNPTGSLRAITSITNPSGGAVTITTGSTAGLANGMSVTISGVSGQTALNNTWIIGNLNVTNHTFELTGIKGDGTASSGGSFALPHDPSLNYTIVNFDQKARTVELSLPVAVTGAVSDTYTFTAPQYVVRSSDAPAATGTAGTIPYTLNFNVPSTAISSISNSTGQPITITTGNTVGLTNGEQVTISGVTGQTAINGTWTISNLTANSFQFVGITGNGGPTGDGTPSSGGTWTPANALQFAQTVYDTMQTMSLLVDPTTLASRSASLLGYIIGGNTGTFVINEALFNQTGRHTLLPNQRTALELRDEIKSLLRGVYSFNAVPDQSKWYPNPATPTPGATLNETNITFGVYNLDPYVWFIHTVLHNSSYGFSFDDDVANAQAASSTLQIAVGGNAYTGPGSQAPNVLSNPETFTQGAPYGTQQSQGFIDLTSPVAIDNATKNFTTISGLSQSVVARLVASDPKKDSPGAVITSSSTGLLPAGVTVVNVTALPTVTGAIAGITNPNGGTITIATANTGNLANGDTVTISGVTGQTAINGTWIVTNVVLNTSFQLLKDFAGNAATGNGVTSSGGNWMWLPSVITFVNPKGYTPPTNNTAATFTFSGFSGTIVPTNITPSVAQALPESVITITGNGLTGVYGVSFNGYPGTIVGGAITSIGTTSSPITINTANTQGLANGDTVTISGVTDQTTKNPAAVNRQWVVTNVVLNTSFQLVGSTANGDPLSGGNWIDGTDSAVKVIVPSVTPNTGNTTYPGPTGKIGVRNPSGTNYSSGSFTIGNLSVGNSSGPTFTGIDNSSGSMPPINNGTLFDVAVDAALVVEGFATSTASAFLEGISSFESLLGSFLSGSSNSELALDTSLIVDGAATGNSFSFFAGLEDMQNLAASLSSAAGQLVTAYEQDPVMALFLSGIL